MSGEGFALELRGITKRFGATAALNDASLAVRSGSLHMLLGENGAGKTTFLNIATGNLQPDTGAILLNGQPVVWRHRADALAAGLSAVSQHFSLVPAMTVAENVALAGPRLGAKYNRREAEDTVRRIANNVGLDLDPAAMVGDLSVAAQQRAEIVKAIARNAPVLMLDEPTAVLSPPDAAELLLWLRGFVSSGRTVVVITHRIREAMGYGDEVTVLRRGQTALSAPISSTSEQEVVAAILGATDTGPLAFARQHSTAVRQTLGTSVLALHAASVIDAGGARRLRTTSLEVRGGEVVGVAGVEGAGQYQLLRLLAGRISPTSGRVTLPPSVGFVPEDRHRDALIADFSLVENMALRGIEARRGVMPWAHVALQVQSAITAFDVRGGDVRSTASALSGGNQQKFVLARELADAPQALVVENPTRGLDVRASQEILTRVRDSAAAGSAVVMYSSDINELLATADRVVVCFAGEVYETTLDSDAIGRAMVGVR
ncbi:MAG: ATP-binding cassette domain-containing protein [Gemmatimonadetes bacterium]|nr:ATP-binding cassette domain-containing protein [Gemmatimonadota bacterium]